MCNDVGALVLDLLHSFGLDATRTACQTCAAGYFCANSSQSVYGAVEGSPGACMHIKVFRPLLLQSFSSQFDHTTLVSPPALVRTLVGGAGLGSVDGIGTDAQFSSPTAVSLAGGQLFVCDTGNHLVRAVNVSTGRVVTLAGASGVRGSTDGVGSAALFSGPSGVAADESGAQLFVADSYNNVLRRVDVGSRTVVTLAGVAGQQGSVDATGSDARFFYPLGIVLHSSASVVYVADYFGLCIRRVNILTRVVVTIAGSLTPVPMYADGNGLAARFRGPWGLAMDALAQKLYISDTTSGTVRLLVLATGAWRC